MTKDKKVNWKIVIFILVLILVLSISSALVIYFKYGKTADEQKLINIEEQISEYDGKKVSGEEVKLLIATIMNHSLDTENDTSNVKVFEYSVKSNKENEGYITGIIDVENDLDSNHQKLVDLRNCIDKDAKYKVTYGRENQKIISIKIEN